MPLDPQVLFRRTHARTLDRLCRRARADRWGLSPERLIDALYRSAEARFGAEDPSRGEVAEYLQALHVEDLALAMACAEGTDAAWREFVERFRPELQAAARAIGDDRARELADSLFADLFGLEERDGRRRSLFRYFHGRSRLATWLRAVLSQRYVDALRSSRRETPLEDDSGVDRRDRLVDQGRMSTSRQHDPDPRRRHYVSMVATELDRAIRALEHDERLRLCYYYVHRLTLAQIGRTMGEHEATVSRKLDRARRRIRQAVEGQLKGERRLTDDQIALCFEYALDEWSFDLTPALSAGAGGRPEE